MADGSVYPSRGRIAFQDASFSAETGTYLVQAEVANRDGELRPGQFVRVRVIGAQRTRAHHGAAGGGDPGPARRIGLDRGQGQARRSPRAIEVAQWTEATGWCVRPARRRRGDRGRHGAAHPRRAGASPRRSGRSQPPRRRPSPRPCGEGARHDTIRTSSSTGRSLRSVLSIIIVVGGLGGDVQPAGGAVPGHHAAQHHGDDHLPRGGSSEVVAQNVAAPIEQRVNGADNMLAHVVHQFVHRQHDAHGVLPRSALTRRWPRWTCRTVRTWRCPRCRTAVTKRGVSVRKRSSGVQDGDCRLLAGQQLVRGPSSTTTPISTSWTHSSGFRAPTRPAIFGTPDYTMRVWLRPGPHGAGWASPWRMSRTAVASQNEQFSAGRIGSSPADRPVKQTFPVATKGAHDRAGRVRATSSCVPRSGDAAHRAFPRRTSTGPSWTRRITRCAAASGPR